MHHRVRCTVCTRTLFKQMIVPELSDEAFRSEFTFEELDSASCKETQVVRLSVSCFLRL